jgi:hypothetical protein
VDNFKREIRINPEATFLDLHNTLLDSVGYSKDELTSFFICDDDWSKKVEITRVEMDTNPEVDTYIMEDTRLEELLEDEHQKMLFVFDLMTERTFFMELREIIPGQDTTEAAVTQSIGEAPAQHIDFEEFDTKISSSSTLGEEFYGDSEYDPDELDDAGFESLDNLSDDMFGDEKF